MQHEYHLTGYSISNLTEAAIWHHSAAAAYGVAAMLVVVPVNLQINDGVFNCIQGKIVTGSVQVVQYNEKLTLTCNCTQPVDKLCEHQVAVLSYILNRDDIRLFFDDRIRYQRLKKFAADYGLQEEAELDQFFEISYRDGNVHVSPKSAALISVTPRSLQSMESWLFAEPQTAITITHEQPEGTMRCVVLKEHKYYKHLMLDLYDAALTKDGKLKNPLTAVAPLGLIDAYDEPSAVKFLTALSHFQQAVEVKKSSAAINNLKAVVQNPLELSFYRHRADVSEKITANALKPTQLSRITKNISITVSQEASFYKVTASLEIGDTMYSLYQLNVRYMYFIELNDTLYLAKNLQQLGLIQLFKSKPELLIYQSQYQQFKLKILAPLEERLSVSYSYIPQATPEQLKEQSFYHGPERMIYLSDFGQFVMIVPVMRYGEVEIPIRTQKLIHAVDDKGKEFLVKRDEAAERDFMALLVKQHPYFEEQLVDDLQYFYLHRKRFLDTNWFLDAFEEWHHHRIAIYGFNDLSGNQLNQHKVKVTIQVLSGVDWFNTKAKVYFGKRRASLKHLHKAIRNKNKFVPLDDGTIGILPEEWVARFASYFEAGEILDDETLITPKINYASISRLYEKQMLTQEVIAEIDTYERRLNAFDGMEDVPLPDDLFANLRSYQRQGLSWLNFLDDSNFGGCLADDMGLGKTLQIIAFILLQRTKAKHNTNLLVVPTSLVFNWQAEVQKFAPSIKVLTLHGADRMKSAEQFEQHEIVLTTYGTLLSDVNFLKNYYFNYIFLDESQNIKNPESSRYKAVRLLQSRNKIAITGTPIENNTFDLFSQLSFACPGLLGSKQYFKDIYSQPIDKFKVSKRAAELQNKIRPFLLRRTKQEVADELPDKTEMVLYCEMQPEQRKIYEAYEKEFREFVSATTNEELPQSSMHVLKGLTRLRQICDSPALLGDYKLPGEASAKIEVLLEQIENRSPQHKILVFSQFVGMLELIKKRLLQKEIKFAYLTGNTRNREAEVNDFQTNPDTRVFLISLKAGGAGLNLTAADYVYLVDPWWNPAVENQAIDRCYRIGQHKNVVAVRLICPNTIEDKVQQLQAAKKELVSSLVNANSSILKALSKADLLDMLNNGTVS